MDASHAFAQCVNTPETGLDLGRAALLIAQTEYPDLDIDRYLKRLNALAAEVRWRLQPPYSATTALAAMNHILFEEQGFSGNVEDYYDPRNSFLNDVLDRKLGIPITLSVLYMEIGRRLDIRLQGVSFPGYFLVKLDLEDGDLVLDPFRGGAPLNGAELANRLAAFFQSPRPRGQALSHLLRGVGKKDILARMLRNLRVIYLRNEDFTRALTIANWILTLCPESAPDIRERAVILDLLECFLAAARDYRRYIDLAPHADDYATVAHRLSDLHDVIVRLN